MSQPAARITDMHTCPMQTPMPPPAPPIPHVGGPILPMPPAGAVTLIGGLPAATVGNMCLRVGPPDSIVKGSTGVLISGKPAARMGDTTAHGGVIAGGFPKVLIGDSGTGTGGGAGAGNALAGAGFASQRKVLAAAAESGAPFCEECERAKREARVAPPASPLRSMLEHAAHDGVPFCEECEKARQALAEPPTPVADREGLTGAAEQGTPFFREPDPNEPRSGLGRFFWSSLG